MSIWIAILCGLAASLLPAPRPARVRPGHRRSVPWAPVAVGSGLFLLVGGTWGIAAGVIGAALMARRSRSVRPDRDHGWADVAPVVVELIAAATRAGVPPAAAVRAAADTLGPAHGSGLAVVAERWRYGLSAVDDSLDRPSLLVARTIERAHDSGAAPASALEHAAAELVADAATLAQERARRVGVQAAVPLGVCLLPAFLCLGVVPLVAGLLSGFAS